ncbi:MAG: tetratricopeptide repeat protein, partial [Clostridia bacterium]|nr:tetratricopeptide repeat protein [Clostridia bacterium]
DNDPQIASINNDLAFSYIETGEYAKAEKALAISFDLQKQLPKASPTYARAKNVLGVFFDRQEKYSDALQCYNEAKEIVISTSGSEHPSIYGYNHNIASVHRLLGNYEEALHLYLNAQGYWEKHAIPLEYAEYSDNVARCYADMGKKAQALPHAQRALDIYKKHLPPDHERIAWAEELVKELQTQEDAKD